jgi:hypothetical protein
MADATSSSTLSAWAGPYVERLLQQGEAFANLPYKPYDRPLSAGFQPQQYNALTGIGNLASPGTAAFYQQYLNPYQQNVTDIAKREATRTSQIAGQQDAAKAVGAGAFGGSRYGLMQAERDRNLQQQLADIQQKGDYAGTQFGLQALGADINRLQSTYGMGASQQALQQAAIDRDRAQYEREQYQYPLEMLKFRQGLLQGLPIATTNYYQQGPSNIQNLAGIASIAANLKQAGFDISKLFPGG